MDELAAPHPRAALDLALLARALERCGWTGPSPQYVARTGSTNADLVAALHSPEPLPEGSVIVTDEQYAGRGRLDRSWEVPPRAAVTWSMVLRPGSMADRQWGWLPLVIGLGVLDGVRDVMSRSNGADRVALKWPNDVVVDRSAREGSAGPRKLGGILVERVPLGPGQSPVVVAGVGLNVDQDAAELPTPVATSLRLEGFEVAREVVLAAAMSSVIRRVQQWRSQEWALDALRREYSRECLSLGSQVRVVRLAQPDFIGTGSAVDAEGRFVVSGAAGDLTVSAGDVVHLR